MTDELEQRLRAADPAPPTVSVDPARSERARALVAHIMADPTSEPTESPRARAPWFLAAAAAAVIAVVAVVVVAGGDDDGGDEDGGDELAGEPVALTAVAEDPLTAICIELTPDTMRDSGIEQAFRGTVTSVDGDVATLDVDEWFVGGDAATVTVTGADGAEVALDGPAALEEGGTYLVSASSGTVHGCGQSGEATAELEAIYAEVFG